MPFFGRAERTVKRWESERGLPVHRLPGNGRSSVFAYTRELADWLSGRTKTSIQNRQLCRSWPLQPEIQQEP